MSNLNVCAKFVSIPTSNSFSMTFQRKNKLGALPFNEEPFDKSPVCLKVREGVKEKLKAIPDWQEQLRGLIDELIKNTGDICK
ncbi:hypothetical protein [Brasilonema octagenarum]